MKNKQSKGLSLSLSLSVNPKHSISERFLHVVFAIFWKNLSRLLEAVIIGRVPII